jgi:hypothetical protein
MSVRYFCFLFAGLVFGAFAPSYFPQSESALRTSVEDHGSVPPVNPWFKCIHELESKSYDNTKV